MNKLLLVLAIIFIPITIFIFIIGVLEYFFIKVTSDINEDELGI